MRKINVIGHEGEAVLVRWLDDDGRYCCGVLPASSVDDGHCSDEELDRSIAYGESWAELIDWPTADEIEQELYRHNLFSYDDVLNSGEVIRGVIMRAFENVLVNLLRLAKENRR